MRGGRRSAAVHPQTSTGTSIIVDISAKSAAVFDDNLEGIANNNDTLYSNSTGSSDDNSDSSHGDIKVDPPSSQWSELFDACGSHRHASIQRQAVHSTAAHQEENSHTW
jgi:hypothetical protein